MTATIETIEHYFVLENDILCDEDNGDRPIVYYVCSSPRQAAKALDKCELVCLGE